MIETVNTVANPSNTEIQWRLVFCDPEPLDGLQDRWAERLFYHLLGVLKPGFRHCFLMRRIDRPEIGSGKEWLIVNPHGARLDIFTAEDGGPGDVGYGAYIDGLVRSGTVRVLDLPQLYPDGLALRPWFSCVEVVKHATGLRPPFWVLTPWQLYRWLIQAGGNAPA